MKNFDWFCLDCNQLRELDSHARCACCSSDSVVPNTGKFNLDTKKDKEVKELEILYRG